MIISVRSKTILFLVDEHKAFLDELSLEFHDESKYQIIHCYNISRFIDILAEKKFPLDSYRIGIIGGYFNGEKDDRIKQLRQSIREIKTEASAIELIVILPEHDESLENELLSIGCYAVFQRNENAFLRITNHVRGIISKLMLEREKRFTRITFMILMVYTAILLLAGAVFLIFFPELILP